MKRWIVVTLAVLVAGTGLLVVPKYDSSGADTVQKIRNQGW